MPKGMLIKLRSIFFGNDGKEEKLRRNLELGNYFFILPGHRLQRLFFLYFLQHFFFNFLPCTMGKAKGNLISLVGFSTGDVLCFMTIQVIYLILRTNLILI